jgi:hypothetical protein
MSFKFINGDVTSNRSLLGANQLGNALQLNAVRDYYKFKILYDNVISNMRGILSSYGDISNNDDISYVDSLNQNLYTLNNRLIIDISNEDIYNNTTVTSLKNFKYDSNLFPFYKDSFMQVLEGMAITIGKIKNNIELKNKNEELTVYQNILNGTDKTLINDYILQRNTEVLVFSASQIVDLDFEIKIWYAEYLRIHGAPSDGFFDLNKLSEIVINLINTQVITLNDFILDTDPSS